MDMKAVSDFVAGVAGGGAAGFLDQKYPKQVAGLTMGTVAGLATAAFGLSKYAGAHKGKILSFGEGMLAGEAYRIVSNKITSGAVALPSSSVAGVRGSLAGASRGVGALPPSSNVISREEILNSIEGLRRSQRVAA